MGTLHEDMRAEEHTGTAILIGAPQGCEHA
jgi:hypothetical protein